MTCPICDQDHGPLIRHFKSVEDSFLLDILSAEKKGWRQEDGACTRCIDQAQLEQWRAGAGKDYPYTEEQPGEYRVLSIPQRLAAHPSYTGEGVTICFIDSGFFPHPDLCQPENRILKAFDIRQPEKELDLGQPHAHSWHGTMTSVVGAGNGWLSGGHYCSLAPDAKVVLIKVMDENGVISGEAIASALQWVLENYEAFGIRIVNLSVSDDFATPYRESPIGRTIACLVEEGVNVVTAVGNSEGETLKAPANSPHAITVGGLDDHNTLHPLSYSLYHSSYGETADQTYKPELIAPAIWVPAPLLPGTAEQREAKALWAIHQTDRHYKKAVAANLLNLTSLPQKLIHQSIDVLEQQVAERIEHAKYISAHYQHSDGTSFAAPIVCSIIAQMLEASPELSPSEVRDLLLRTARPLNGLPAERQGFGVVHPLSAIYHAEKAKFPFPLFFNPTINYQAGNIRFQIRQEAANMVSAIGAFNGWQQPGISMKQGDQCLWEVEIPLPAPGIYPYKYLINGIEWHGDTRNLYRRPDGLGGFDSLLIVENGRPDH
jgi:serine protease AprX